MEKVNMEFTGFDDSTMDFIAPEYGTYRDISLAVKKIFTDEADRLYNHNDLQYDKFTLMLKDNGAKVYRNTAGQHKLVIVDSEQFAEMLADNMICKGQEEQ